ncbi:efflux RND transporter periplasmic adaptor subunit [Stenotrophomonas sp. SORGH_AS_0321]|uniref:efflux RND transporter periplasmic adaptor subunit n=1 Tax=Stenotrophomonas sp. SORGH_AS_0321 TaxID=3041787 RepID=UPI00285DCBB3|nr:efflux RND transporter periplasmic adaptor subunit [Stenotrophomonas sp. SORGH_AS_0321]MDR6092712.1 multidrug resistance efflux pump [Stenotrophomonas sp. SORGH_AS_0321]
MKKIVNKALPPVLTVLAVIVALLVLRQLWVYYMDEPWTRDAHIGADVVQVAPDVSGLVEAVDVGDNQAVKKGALLFVVDRARYRIALELARASLAERQATVAQLHREIARDRSLQDLVAGEDAEVRRAKLQAAQAAQATAQAAVDLAVLNLARTEVRAPADGQINDRTVRVGDYVTAGKPVLALLDTTSFRVDGYFEETRLRGVAPGQPVDIRLMGEDVALQGHVESIAAGIEDRYRTDGSSLLPNVTPAFDWVRLAQRIPVRIRIDQVPAGVQLISGRTATVTVDIHGTAAHKAGVAPARAGL